MTDRYAVIGNPIAHSKSPQIHAAFARETGQDISYERLLAPLDAFTATVQEFREQGGCGSNVTLPFKLEACVLADEVSPRARLAGAANTLAFRDGIVFADNTDGAGITRDIVSNLGCALRDTRVLMLGAGGAAQGVLAPLMEHGVKHLVIANRTVERAQELAADFAAESQSRHCELFGCGFAQLAGKQFDILINATSSSLQDELPPLPPGLFAPGSLAYDMMYGKGLSPFLHFAQTNGAARVADGVGMLVEQAAESFFLWRGVRPSTLPVIAQLRAS
jgi:shikimate dehydrogenase